MKFFMRSLLFLTLTGLLAACGTAEKKPLLSTDEALVLKGYNVVGPVKSIPNFRLNGWSYVNDEFIIVTAGVRDHYLLGFRFRCPETASAMNIGIDHMVGSVTRSDKVIVRAPGGYTDTCFIDTITRLERVRKKPEEE